jgi:hypothetical protein
MPEEITESSAESVSDTDAAALFETESDAAAPAPEPADGTSAAAKVDDAPAGDEPNADASAEAAPTKVEKPVAAKAEKPDPSKVATEKLQQAEEVVRKREEDAERKLVADAAKKQAAEEEKTRQAAAEKAKQPVAFDDVRANALKAISGMKFVDPTDDNDQATVDAEEWAKKYPGIFDMVVAVATNLGKAGTGAMDEAAVQRLQALEATESARQWEGKRQSVFSSLAESDMGGHEDAQKIIDSKEYAEWVGKQSKAVQTLADDFDPASQRIVIEAYKAANGIVNEAVVKAKSAKAKTDAVHSTTLRSRPSAPSPSADAVSDDEAKRLFDEAAAEEAKRN